MSRAALIALAWLVVAPAAAAQPMDHSMHGMAMPGMAAPAPTPTTPADPHAGHDMSAMSSASDMSGMDMYAPPAAGDHAADKSFDPAAMAAARAQLRLEHGAVSWSKVTARLAEYQSGPDGGGYHWDAQASWGGDINRLVVKSEGQGAAGHRAEAADLQALYSRAVSPFFNLQAGVRQDLTPGGRTYAVLGTEGIAPYWIDVEAALFLSTEGELLARAEATHDLRLTQRLILQRRVELNFSAQDTPATRTGAGLSNAELGLRLRYELRREFAPYVGVSYDRRFGKTADYARAAGREPAATSLVVGLSAWF